MLAVMLKEVGNERKLIKDLAHSYFKPFCLIPALTDDISFPPFFDSTAMTEVHSSPSLPFILRHNVVIILTFLKVGISP